MPELRVETLTKTFNGTVTALSDVSFDVADQEFVFLLGPSGAGKTTTLRLIAGLEQPTAGRVFIGGKPAAGLSPRDRNVAMVYDKHSLYPHLSVFDNLAYPLRLRKTPADVMAQRIHDTAEILGIGPLLERHPRALSGGQLQRVAIGRALVRDANAYLMDEPISALDAKLRSHMRVEFKRLQKEFAATILYVTNDQLEAMTMGDRIVVINEGVVQQIGTPRDIFDRPANLFVAKFVGEPTMNTLPCRLVQEAGAWHVRGESFAVTVAEAWVNRHGLTDHAGKPLVLGLRPHRLELAGADDVGQTNVETGKVYAVETLGSETIYDVEIENEVLRVWSRNRADPSLRGRLGAPIHFRIDPDAMYLFDAATGHTLAQAGASFERAA